MIKGLPLRSKAPFRRSASDPSGEMRFAVELWNLARTDCERIAGRAESPEVAHAIYEAVVQEFPFRLVVLRQGEDELRSTR